MDFFDRYVPLSQLEVLYASFKINNGKIIYQCKGQIKIKATETFLYKLKDWVVAKFYCLKKSSSLNGLIW